MAYLIIDFSTGIFFEMYFYNRCGTIRIKRTNETEFVKKVQSRLFYTCEFQPTHPLTDRLLMLSVGVLKVDRLQGLLPFRLFIF